MIVRDKYGIIVQQPDMDGGDSAFTTGIMSFSGSNADHALMYLFITDNNQLVRHPYQLTNTGTAPHNDPKSISRDQVLAFFSGAKCLRVFANPALKESCELYASSWFVNNDILMPASKLHLYKCADLDAPMLLYPFAYLNLILHLIWACFIAPKDTEMNQTALMCATFGRLWLRLLIKYHPDLYGNINDYFSGWRDKAEIGQMFIDELKYRAV